MKEAPAGVETRSSDEELRLWACQRDAGDSIANAESERWVGARSTWDKSRAAGKPLLASFSSAAAFIALHLKARLAGGPHNTPMLLKGGGALMGRWAERAAGEAIAKAFGRPMDPARTQRIDSAEDAALSMIQDAYSPRWTAIKKADAWRLAEPELLARKLYDTLVYERMKGWIEFAHSGAGRLKDQIALDVALLSERGRARALSQTSPSLDETLTLLSFALRARDGARAPIFPPYRIWPRATFGLAREALMKRGNLTRCWSAWSAPKSTRLCPTRRMPLPFLANRRAYNYFFPSEPPKRVFPPPLLRPSCQTPFLTNLLPLSLEFYA